jgi:hypothetical protein
MIVELEDDQSRKYIVANIHLGENMRKADKFGKCPDDSSCLPETFLKDQMTHIFTKAYGENVPTGDVAIIVGGDFNGTGEQNENRETPFNGMQFNSVIKNAEGGILVSAPKDAVKDPTCCVDKWKPQTKEDLIIKIQEHVNNSDGDQKRGGLRVGDYVLAGGFLSVVEGKISDKYKKLISGTKYKELEGVEGDRLLASDHFPLRYFLQDTGRTV